MVWFIGVNEAAQKANDYDSLGLASAGGAGKHKDGQKQTSFHKSLSFYILLRKTL